MRCQLLEVRVLSVALGSTTATLSRVGSCGWCCPSRRVGRADDRGTLEKCRRATFRGFESHTRLVKLSDVIKHADALIGRHGDGEFYVEVQGRVERVKMLDYDKFDSDEPTSFIAMGDGNEV